MKKIFALVVLIFLFFSCNLTVKDADLVEWAENKGYNILILSGRGSLVVTDGRKIGVLYGNTGTWLNRSSRDEALESTYVIWLDWKPESIEK